ncbi:hypothetical protein AAC387_Pa03g1453 [Persea americana]
MLETHFLTQFKGEDHPITMAQLCSLKQGENESTCDFIHKWKAMVYKCSDVLPQASLVDICRNNMTTRIRSMIIGNKSKNLGELLEASMEAETVIKDLNSQKSSKKEPTAIPTSKPKKKEVLKVQTKSTPQPPKKTENRAPGKRSELSDAFKERAEKKYPFDEDVEEIFGALLANGKLTFPNPKRPGDVGKTNDPRYCPYHQMVLHPLNQCFIVREKINEMWKNGVITFDKNYASASVNMVSYGQTSESPKEKITTSFKIVKTKPTTQQRRQAKRQLHKVKQQEKAQPKQKVPEKAETSSTASLPATEESLPKTSRVVKKFTLSDFMPPRLGDETTQGASYSCNSYNPFQPQGSWSDDDEDQEVVQQSAVDPAQTNALVEHNQVEPQGADEEEDLAPMPDLEEYARILQRLAIEQEQARINQLHQNVEPEVLENLQASPPVTLENEESCWIDDPLTSEDEFESQQSILEAFSIEVACNVIVQDDSASEASSAEATDSQNASGSISSGATSSRVTSTEIVSSQPSSPETMTSEFEPLPTGHHEEALADEVFKEDPVNLSQIPNLIGDVWTDETLDKEEKLLKAVQDLFPENAPCNTITEDDNAVAEVFSANQDDRPLEPEGGLPKEEPPLEAFEVGKGTRFGRDYHKSYNQSSSSSYVNPSGKQTIKALSGNNNENAGPKEAFKYDSVEHFKDIPARLHILDLLRMLPQTRDSLILELQRPNVDVDKHTPQVLQIEMDYRVKKSKTSSKGEKKETKRPCTECLSVQKASSATITFNKEDLLLGETKHNRPLYFIGYIKEMTIHKVQIDPGSALNLISTLALEELVTVYAIKTHSCYNIILGRPWIYENGVVPSTLHQCIKFVGDDGLIHRVFAEKKPFKGKEVHFADSQMYRDEKEEKEEQITYFAGNLQKDKGKAPQQSLEENKPSGKSEESNPSPFVVSFKSSKPLMITTKAKKTKQKTGGKFVVSFVSIIQDTNSDSEISKLMLSKFGPLSLHWRLLLT